jgi:hypothetical protein
MLVAIMAVHHTFGFFMNWTGTQKGEGFEFHLLVLAMVAFLMIRGAGAFSVDRLLTVWAPSRMPESRLARYFSSCPSDSISRWTPCPPKYSKRWL